MDPKPERLRSNAKVLIMPFREGFELDPPQAPYLSFAAASGEIIVSIHADGRVEVNPKFTVDEAARVFWDAVKALAEGGGL